MHKTYKNVGQAAFEYLIVVGTALLLLAPIIVVGQNAVDGLKKDSDMLITRQTLNKITEASELVFAQGPPASVTLTAQIPTNINEIIFEKNMIIMKLNVYERESDIISIMDFNVTGLLPKIPGTYKINIRAIDNGVNITKTN
ncbi:MAG: hypothetical protein KAS12_06230 [Candidatus Aenigmarchaeota archaeon]|nr:hypothetical protein [Candidatus Aenigmarchaeota archaeon]